jgi:hypothetical protein
MPSATRVGVSTVDLISFLLLGAPDGKTEMIHGAVRRVVVLASPEAAEEAFRAVASEICAFCGIRAIGVEGPVWQRGRFRLERAGLQLWLDVAMSEEQWSAYG